MRGDLYHTVNTYPFRQADILLPLGCRCTSRNSQTSLRDVMLGLFQSRSGPAPPSLPVARSLLILFLSLQSAQLSLSAPVSSSTCFDRLCRDDLTFRTGRGQSCAFHSGIIDTTNGNNCLNEWAAGDTWFSRSYDASEIIHLARHCPCSCNVSCRDEPTLGPYPISSGPSESAVEFSGRSSLAGEGTAKFESRISDIIPHAVNGKSGASRGQGNAGIDGRYILVFGILGCLAVVLFVGVTSLQRKRKRREPTPDNVRGFDCSISDRNSDGDGDSDSDSEDENESDRSEKGEGIIKSSKSR